MGGSTALPVRVEHQSGVDNQQQHSALTLVRKSDRLFPSKLYGRCVMHTCMPWRKGRRTLVCISRVRAFCPLGDLRPLLIRLFGSIQINFIIFSPMPSAPLHLAGGGFSAKCRCCKMNPPPTANPILLLRDEHHLYMHAGPSQGIMAPHNEYC